MNKQALKKSRIRKGDVVVVIAGRDRGKSGKVLSVDPGVGKVVVEKVEYDQAPHQAESEGQARRYSRTGSALLRSQM